MNNRTYIHIHTHTFIDHAKKERNKSMASTYTQRSLFCNVISAADTKSHVSVPIKIVGSPIFTTKIYDFKRQPVGCCREISEGRETRSEISANHYHHNYTHAHN